jgi:hypothetical protein
MIPAVAAIVIAVVAAPRFWKGGTLTLSEAAALRDEGEVVQLVDNGTDPNAAYTVRDGVLAASPLTPLEAAVGARRAEMVYLLMRHGAKVDAGSWRRLHCFALNTGAGDVVEMLDRFKPAGAATSCEGISTPF